MIRYNKECLSECLEELKPLLEDNSKEINKYNYDLNPNYEAYWQLESLGMLHLLIAREEGVIVGYCIIIINPHLHFQHKQYATVDVLYVSPSKRGGFVAYKLLRLTEEMVKDLGGDVLVLAVSDKKPFHRLCKKLNFSKLETLYTKFIGD